ncbi:hypothetical protein [Thermogemmatispora sp.]|uniref:hypothetical protein n=1 Tax=Thermogemmatispora sp. TaxID=1968838 RepID=UPI001D33699C|nr:hypothetical protein [Thermogemmatispora sp.]MBX5449407.1 hypothetical protein [Thermogemmatispora sp.]
MSNEAGQEANKQGPQQSQPAATHNNNASAASSSASATDQELNEALESGFRPLTRMERRQLWLREYGEQDVALQMWIQLVEQHDLEIEMMLQMHGLLIFGVMVSTAHYAQFYIDLNEETHREHDPDTADALRKYYTALVPPRDQPEYGPEGLPIVYHYIHMRDVTILSGGHKFKVPYWRGKASRVDAFVVGATVGD